MKNKYKPSTFVPVSRLAVWVPVAAVALSSMVACQKKSSSSSDSSESNISAGTAGVSSNDSANVKLVGVLDLGALALADSTQGVLAFNMSSGKIMSQQEVAVAEDGSFTVDVAKADEAVQILLDEMDKSPSERDWEAMWTAAKSVTDLNGMTAADLEKMSEDELEEGIAELARELQDAGAMTLLVAYDITGDKTTEAESFRFISLPTAGGKALNGLPNADLKGDVSFGAITGSGADVSAEIEANDALDLSSEALDSLADAGRALKMVKNEYMNDNWSVQPFYFWSSNVSKDDVIGKFSDISKNSYHGYGFYVPSVGDQGLTYNDICGSKVIKFTPPAAIVEKDWEDNTTNVSAYSNVGATKSTQGESRICQGNGYYAREDVRDGETSYMLNFGTGGSIQDSPEGLWKLTVGGVEKGRYDLALASPMVDGKPVVLLPQVKFNVSANKVTTVEVELYRWNGTDYEKVTDMAPVKKLFSELSASITRTSDNGESRTRLTVNDDGTITGAFDSSSSDGGDVVNPPVVKTDVSSFAVYYNIGNASYRMEFR